VPPTCLNKDFAAVPDYVTHQWVPLFKNGSRMPFPYNITVNGMYSIYPLRDILTRKVDIANVVSELLRLKLRTATTFKNFLIVLFITVTPQTLLTQSKIRAQSNRQKFTGFLTDCKGFRPSL
jgi:hypothetical protein